MKRLLLFGSFAIVIACSALMLTFKTEVAETVPIWGIQPIHVAETIPIWGDSIVFPNA